MMTAAKDYGVKVTVAYADFRVGDVIYPPGMLREMLKRQGFVEDVPAPEPVKRGPGRPRIHPLPTPKE